MNLDLKCGDCEFYANAYDEKGVCRRFPPVPIVEPARYGGVDVKWQQPVVSKYGQCGEFKRKGTK